MKNVFGYEVDPNAPIGEQLQQAREAKGVFTGAEFEALRQLEASTRAGGLPPSEERVLAAEYQKDFVEDQEDLYR
jgi:hypothetical protein